MKTIVSLIDRPNGAGLEGKVPAHFRVSWREGRRAPAPFRVRPREGERAPAPFRVRSREGGIMKTIGSMIDRPSGACLAGGCAPAHFRVSWQEGGARPHPLGIACGKETERQHLLRYVRGQEVL